MTQIHSYLTFNGNCLEAMRFYQACLGGELTLQTLGMSPFAAGMPDRMKSCIVQATLKQGAIVIMASDMVGENGLKSGNSVSMFINCSSEEEMRGYFQRLSEDGRSVYPIAKTHWDALFGQLTDKYGNSWLLSYQQ